MSKKWQDQQMSKPSWRKVSAPAQGPPMSPRHVPQGGSPVLGSSGRRARGVPGERPHRSEDLEATDCDSGAAGFGEVPPHALFLQHRGPKPPDWGVYEGSGGAGAEDDEARHEDQRRASGDLQKLKTKKKSIGDKFSFLSRRSADASAAGTRTIRPLAEQVQRWGASFDSLLTDKYGLALFRAFLKTEYSDENIEFWIACEEYRTLVGPKKQTLKAQKIYSEFVAFQAPREVNLDSTTRLATINAMGSPDGHLFELAQKRIQALMEKDSYQRFLRSDEYQNLLMKDAAPAAASSSSSTASAPATATAASDEVPPVTKPQGAASANP